MAFMTNDNENTLALVVSSVPSPLPSPNVSPPSSPILPSASPSYLNPSLIEACRLNDLAHVSDLINSGADVNFKDTNNFTPLYAACNLGNSDCVSLLLEHGADAYALCGKGQVSTPIRASIKNNHPKCLKNILEKSPPTQWEKLVEEAILGDRSDCLALLLEQGANVNSTDNYGSTPLHAAAKFGKLACAEVLLNYGANIDALDMDEKTPYDIAIDEKRPWAKKLLLINDGSFNNNNMSASLSQSLSQNDYDEKPVNLSTILYHDLSTENPSSSLPFSLTHETSLSQASQYSQQSQLGTQDLNPVHAPRYVKPNFEIDFPDLEIFEEIGAGFYGKVFRGIWQGGTPVAVKQLTSGDGKLGEITRKNFRLEMEMLMALRHPNIVLFLGVSIQSPNLYLIMELLPRGSLSDFLHMGTIGKNLALKTRIRMAFDVACGMNYLHKQTPEPILHRDLKSGNLLVTDDFRIKVSDFGLARVKHSRFNVRNPLDISIMAPEVLGSKPIRYTEKSDIYSYGLLLWELVTVEKPFASMTPQQIAAEVLKKNRPPIPVSCPEYLSQLMAKCWDDDPSVRPTFQEIVKELRPHNLPQNLQQQQTPP